jgi:hypothetical protein
MIIKKKLSATLSIVSYCKQKQKNIEFQSSCHEKWCQMANIFWLQFYHLKFKENAFLLINYHK